MRNTATENIAEHSLSVAIIAHALAVIHNVRLGGSVSPERAATLALFHDCPEILTGDLPTPVKYYNPEISNAYKQVEDISANKLLSMLPDDISAEYRSLFFKQDDDKPLWKLVKTADKIDALIKCIEEVKSGNSEFKKAKQSTLELVKKLKMPEADIFLKEFLPAYSLTIDELD